MPHSAIRNPAVFLVARITMQGFIVSDHLELWPQGLSEVAALLLWQESSSIERRSRRISRTRPEAFIGLLRGKNFGKQVVKLI